MTILLLGILFSCFGTNKLLLNTKMKLDKSFKKIISVCKFSSKKNDINPFDCLEAYGLRALSVK